MRNPGNIGRFSPLTIKTDVYKLMQGNSLRKFPCFRAARHFLQFRSCRLHGRIPRTHDRLTAGGDSALTSYGKT